MQDVLLDVAEIAEVIQKADCAVFLEVKLRHYHDVDGEPLEARARLCVPYHGDGFGDWWIPDVGSEVMCFFPGLGLDGMAGGDLDEGFAFALPGTRPRPPAETGLGGDLSTMRRVYKGRSGEAVDRHVQGDVDVKVDGAESHETVGVFTWLLRAAAKLASDATLQLFGAAVEIGAGAAVQRLVDERFVALFNSHTHNSGSPPDQTMVVGSHTTTVTKAD